MTLLLLANDHVSVWRPLVGPNNDWPLALCDFTSVDVENDIVPSDLLHNDREAENVLLHPNSKHRWYYLQNQQIDELLVFRNIDSTGKRASKITAVSTRELRQS